MRIAIYIVVSLIAVVGIVALIGFFLPVGHEHREARSSTNRPMWCSR